MKKTCLICTIDKNVSEFHFRKETQKYRNQCKECGKYTTASRRYGISFNQAKNFYKEPKCMCCDDYFLNRKHQHLHHVKHKVHGVLCRYCNLVLGQETQDDMSRITACLKFMSRDRKNLFDRDNQQGSQQTEFDPSTTECPTHLRKCKVCNKCLPKGMFYRQKYTSGKYGHYAACKECYKIIVKTYKYGLTFNQVQYLRSIKTCQCCQQILKVPYIHHIGNEILATLCRECNIILEQESQTTMNKLKACKRWMEMIQSDLLGNMQKHTEMLCSIN